MQEEKEKQKAVSDHSLEDRIIQLETNAATQSSVDSLDKRMEKLESKLWMYKGIYNQREACEYLGISSSYLYKLTCQRLIAHYKPRGKTLFFKKEDLDHWMLQGQMEVESQTNRYTRQ